MEILNREESNNLLGIYLFIIPMITGVQKAL